MPNEEPTPPAPGGSDWRAALAPRLAPGPLATTGSTLLGLQFELRELIPRTAHRWNGPTSRAAGSAADGRGDYRLGVRPVARTARGWARGSLTWSNLPHLLNRMELDADQHRWFCQFGALHRAAVPPATGQDPDWVFLDEFGNPVLWALLDQAGELGIPFVGAGSGASVRVAGAAALGLDVVGTDGGLRIEPRLAVDGVRQVARAGAIGNHGVYLFDPARPRELVLAPAAEPLDAERLALLKSLGTEDARTAVPPGDVDEFLRDFLPALRDRVEVGSSDASVPMPPPPPPVLVLTAAFAAGFALRLEWRWERRRGAAEPPPLAEVLPPGLLPPEWLAEAGPVPLPATLSDLDAAEFAATVLPELRKLDGVRVDTVGTPPDYRELTGTPRLTVTTVPTERHDWFDLGVTVSLDGRTIPFVPLFKGLATGKRRILLADGAYLTLNHPAFGPLKELIEEAKDLP
ncbi:MAG: hypothetical protein QOE37_233, partial [Microbacteriaceae bacterium]|nr:hypothetical protein [Microbacteriaceae bacterium]